MRPTRTNLMAAGALVVLAVIALLIFGRSYNPNALGNMPGPVQQVLDTATLSGNTIAVNILKVTGNQDAIGRGTMPGDYSYGPVTNAGDYTYYVVLDVPIDMEGIAKQLGYEPHIYQSDVSSGNPESTSSVAYDNYVNILTLPNMVFDRLYFDPNTHMAEFSFRLNSDGTVLDESWDAVSVNS